MDHEPTNQEVLTVEEAARLLRIGRNAAYNLAHEWRATGGRTGLPCVKLGRSLRVPVVQLQDILQGRVDTSTAGTETET